MRILKVVSSSLLIAGLPTTTGFLAGDSTTVSRHHHSGFKRIRSNNGNKEKVYTVIYQSDRPYFVSGPDPETVPDYESIHGPMGKTIDDVFLSMFRTKLAEQVGVDSDKEKTDYEGLMDLVKAMNARFSDRAEIQRRSQKTLSLLFPSWMPPSYSVLFSKPFPAFSSRMNAWATMVAGTWLMGECEVNDVEIDNEGTIGVGQGLLVKRCRFLEESQCASHCVNSCKIPTQNFFLEEMGLPLTMTPDYETYECQFTFGLAPDEASELEAKNTPCLSRCPSAGGLREKHNGNTGVTNAEEQPQCQLMD